MNIDLSSEEKVIFLTSMRKRMGLSADEVLAIYLLLGDKIFFLFDLLQDKTVKFPSMRSFHRGLNQVGSLRLIKLKHALCMVNGVESYRESIVLGDCVEVDGIKVEALESPFNFLGAFYLLVKDLSGGKND